MRMITVVGCICALMWSCPMAVDGVPYEVLLTGFEAIPQDITDYLDYGTIRLTRQGKNKFGVSGTFYVFQNAGKEIQVNWVMYNIDFIGQKFKFIDGSGSLCNIISNDEFIYPRLLETSNMPSSQACPFPKGNYTITNFVLDDERFPVAAQRSDWMVEAIMTRETKVIGGFRISFKTK